MRSGLLRKIQPPLGQVTGDVVARMQDATSDAVEALVAAANQLSLPLVVAPSSYAIRGNPMVVFTGPAGCIVTLPPAAAVDAGTSAFQFVANVSANAVSVIASGRDTVNGAMSLSLATSQVAMLVSDGVSRWVTPPGIGVTLVDTVSTQTLTNKRMTPRVVTIASSATPTIATDSVDYFSITALAVAITSVAVTGTPTDAQRLWVAITGTAARAITWGASFEASTVALPATTVGTARLDVEFIWNAATSKWRCVRAV